MKTPIKYIKTEFFKAILDLKGKEVEYFLNDGSSSTGTLEYFNPHTGEYYILDKFDNVHLINHFNCLKIIVKR